MSAPTKSKETYFIPSYGGRIQCYVPGLKLVDFYRSQNPPPEVSEAPQAEKQKHSARIFKLKR